MPARIDTNVLVYRFDRRFPEKQTRATDLLHLWAFAETFGMGELLSEDFQHDRMYGRVRAINPFA